MYDPTGAALANKRYDPFGNVMSATGAGSVYGFTGEATDATGLVFLRARYMDPYLNQFIQPDTIVSNPRTPADWNKYTYVRDNPINFTDPNGRICLDPWAPSGVHLDPNRGCEYPEGSTGALWWRRDPLGPDTAIIEMPWVDEQSEEIWNRYPNSCGVDALYMFLRGEGVPVVYETLVQQLQSERPGGYNGYCCRNQITGANGVDLLPTPTPDPLGWCNEACVSAAALADVAMKFYGLNIISGDNWTHEEVYRKVRSGHPVLTLVRSELTTTYFGHFVVIRGFVDGGWTVMFNDSYPGEDYWDVRGGSSEKRRQVGEGRREAWDKFDASWASSVDAMDPLSPGGHVRWAMAVR
ncbi:MAG: C39 family peptidase [Chloroflexi bacterium]|nr:C39 family peptidase [Chloroflexota bacterium]